MLQWMGGSRRKVTASRKSMHNRQKQYFEQRKRQQQAPGLENHNDVRNKRAHYQEEPRSLDILSLTNLATIAHGDYSSHINGKKADLGSLQVDCKPSELSPAMMLKKITCQYFNNLEETCSTAFLNKLSAAGSPQDAPAGHSLSSKLDDCKMPGSPCEFISNNTGSKSKEQQEEVQNEVSILDLLGDDGPKGKPEGRSVPEAHVAFSVEGLGKVGMETPVHSPRPHKRGFPSPPKASRCMHSSASLKSVSYDLGLELNAIMHDVSMSMDDSLPEILCNSRGLFNDMVFTNRTKSMDSYVCPDVFENRTNNFNDKEEIILAETRNKQWKSRSDVLDDDFLDGGKYDVLWKKTPFCSDGYPTICPNSKSSEIYDYGFGDNYFLKKRTAVEAHKRSDTSAPSSPYFSYSTSEKEYDFLALDQDRYPVPKERSNLDSMFDPPAWSFLKTEDSKDSMSLLSEESCSSAAVREERSNGLRSDQMKLKDCKISHLDELHMSFDKKYNLEKVLEDEMIYTSLGRASGERNLAGMENDKSISNQLSLKAGYCSEKASSHQGILEPNCISLFKNERRPANVASLAPSCPKSSTETNTAYFDCNILHEDKLFDHFPVPKLNPTADLIQRRSESKVPSECEPSSNFNCENVEQLSAPGIQFLKSEAHPLGAGYFPYLSSAKYFYIDIQMPDSSGQRNADKDNGDQNRYFEESENKISIKNYSLNSLSGETVAVADCKDSCSEHEESKYEELLDGPKTRNPFEEAGETALPTEELPLHLKKSSIDEKSDLSDGRCPVQYEVSNRDPMKEKLGPEKSFVKMGGNKTDTSYQVMHESYVLQLMCVQKVLMEASGKDDGKKVRELPFVHQFGEKTC